MSSQQKATLARLRDSGLRKISHFHCDHFEPEYWIRTAFDPEWLSKYVDRMGPRPSLFVYIPFGVYLDGSQPEDRFLLKAGADEVAFVQPDHWDCWKSILMGVESAGCDFHLHVHHEDWTNTTWPRDRVTPQWHDVYDWVRDHPDQELDNSRFQICCFLARKSIEDAIGCKLGNIGFIHGRWALAGSDPRICTIVDELRSLHAQGIVADFSFPAGRKHCDATIQRPFSCLPVVGHRPWELKYSKQKIVEHFPIDQTRFLIWNQGRASWNGSLDYYSRPEPGRQEWRQRLLNFITGDMPIIDGVGYIKTHSHSMHPFYVDETKQSPLELFQPSLDWLATACTDSGVEFERLSVAGLICRAFDKSPESNPSKSVK